MTRQRGKQHFVQVQNMWMVVVEEAALRENQSPAESRENIFLVQ